MRRTLLVAAVGWLAAAGCVNKDFPEHLPCADHGECPPNQVCFPPGGPGVCADPNHPPADAAPPDVSLTIDGSIDATPIDAPAPVDAPVDGAVAVDVAMPDLPILPDVLVVDGPLMLDVAIPDSRPVDASPPDASPPDASLPDAHPPDAPPPPDVALPDARGVDVAGVCDPVLKNCMGGEACYWRSPGSGGTECANPGTGMSHTPCPLGNSSCASGFGCQSNPQGMECMPYCTTSDFTCNPVVEQCTPLDSSFGLCQSIACDPASQNLGCPCYYDPMHKVGVCAPSPGTGVQGDSCTPAMTMPPSQPCAQDFDCTACTTGHQCAQYCDDSHPCDNSASCTKFSGQTYGSCKTCN